MYAEECTPACSCGRYSLREYGLISLYACVRAYDRTYECVNMCANECLQACANLDESVSWKKK